MKKIIGIIVFTLIIAGCVGQSVGPTQADIADVLTATNQPVIPSQPTAGSSFTVRINVQNQHATEFANGVEAWLFDTGKCTATKINDVEVSPASKKEQGYALLEGMPLSLEETPLRFAPGQQEVVKINFNAPRSEEIVGMSATCPIRYKVKYDFSAKSEMSFDVISEERLAQIEAEKGERPVSERMLNIGPGPIRISVEPKTSLPVVTGRKMQIEVYAKNVGNGNMPDGEIPKEKLELRIPNDIKVDTELEGGEATLCNGKFTYVDEQGKHRTYKNAEEIQFVKGQTNAITCYLKAPDATVVSTERQYTIGAVIQDYKYEYFGQDINVVIKP